MVTSFCASLLNARLSSLSLFQDSTVLMYYLFYFYFLRAEQKKVKKLTKEKEGLNKELSAQNDRVRELEKKLKEFEQKVKSLEDELQSVQKQLKLGGREREGGRGRKRRRKLCHY